MTVRARCQVREWEEPCTQPEFTYSAKGRDCILGCVCNWYLVIFVTQAPSGFSFLWRTRSPMGIDFLFWNGHVLTSLSR